jgi:hypothetical protein
MLLVSTSPRPCAGKMGQHEGKRAADLSAAALKSLPKPKNLATSPGWVVCWPVSRLQESEKAPRIAARGLT